jgi:hypothetical protein
MVLGCVVLAGCAANVGPTNGRFADDLAVAIEDAEANGAGETQLSVLRHAQEVGGVTLEDARAAARAAVECMQDAGVDATYQEETEESGLVVPGYVAGWTNGQAVPLAVIDACDQRDSFWVSMIYQTQPSSLESNDAYLERQLPVLIACLNDHGYTTDPSASPADLVRHALDVANQTGGTIDCVSEAGIDGV